MRSRGNVGEGSCGTGCKDVRYLPGTSMVKSEIVVPIFLNKKLAAELDVESYFANTFTRDEQEFVETCAGVVAKQLAKA